MQVLPIGVHDFVQIRQDNMLYVDKTAQLQKLVETGRRYFLARPRRFGKSLTISTLEAMFSGRVELFKGLAAEDWVKKQAEHPAPVLRFDMSAMDSSSSEALKQSLSENIILKAVGFDIELRSTTLSMMLTELLIGLYKRYGRVAVLIDEYDKPILDNLSNFAKATEMREILRSFYTVLKSCDDYLRFVLLTGISKFSKMGIFSAMNNLIDISMYKEYGAVAGYTQQELEHYFTEIITDWAEQMQLNREELLKRLKDYYDGFSFDGATRLYNPFSILNFFFLGEFKNYWYESGSPSFITEWMKEHQIQNPEEYRHIVVNGDDFISTQEIERADAVSFLYQSGYLTIEKKEGRLLTLDYPNKEVLNSLASNYLKLVYKVKDYAGLGSEIWEAVKAGDISRICELYNIALAEIPYDDFAKNRNEYWYRSMFMMLLRGVGIITYAEIHTSKGRSDVVIQLRDLIIVLEFKYAAKSSEVKVKLSEGAEQIKEREYAKSYAERKVLTAVFTADDEKRQAVYETVKATAQ